MAESCPDIELPPPPPPLPEDSEPGPESVLQDEENNEELSDEYPMPGEEEDEQEEQEDEVPSLLKEDASQDFLFEENESDVSLVVPWHRLYPREKEKKNILQIFILFDGHDSFTIFLTAVRCHVSSLQMLSSSIDTQCVLLSGTVKCC